jgi:ribonucleotide reductase alpha subunit
MSNKEIQVEKRNGLKVPLDFEKINKILIWATENINGVYPSDIAMNAKLQIYDGITTKEIHNVLIRASADMISEKNPNYQYVAGNLLNYKIRKDVFGGGNLPKLYDLVEKNVENGIYDKNLIKKYSEEEFDKYDKIINHSRDFNFTYAGIQQLVDKYLLKDRKTNTLYETPQFAYMLIAMTVFGDVEEPKRYTLVKDAYYMFSKHKISLPTPIMAGVRTPNKQWSSCTLIDVADNLDSIFNSNSAVGYYTSKRAGIGLNMGSVRALGDVIRNGEVIHTGVIPFLRMFQSTTKSCTQNGIRGGSASIYFPFWHKEIEDILVLKNNKGTDDNRVRHMDYGIQMNRLIYRRIVKNEMVSLFSPNDVPDLYDSFFKSNDLFESLYEKYENDPTINKKQIKSTDLINLLAQERIGTGRIYVMNVDHANDHSSFLDPVKMSNLCVAPETQILTSSGYQTISELEGENVEIWNGKEWSETKVIKTGENQKLLNVSVKYTSFNNDNVVTDTEIVSIDVTEYHKWYDVNGNELRTTDLYSNLVLEKSNLPNSGYRNFEVLSIEDNNRYDDTYCVNEPKEHKVMFNGVLTGNCAEITLPTTPLTHIDDDDSTDAEIALCVLAAINLGAIKELSEFEKIMDISVRVLDFIIENQDYPVKAALKMLKRRSLGIGITNFAYWLAKNNVNYDDPNALPLVDELMEYMQYYGIKASVNLAKEYGHAEYFNRTKYSKGILPIDTYNKNVDTIVNRKYSLDWEELRNDVLKYGMRNSTISALMPCESSSLISNSTNGIEPIRDYITTKKSKQGLIRLVVPEYSKLKNKYQLAFNIDGNKGITNIHAVITKWIDQAISANHYYDITKFKDNEIPMSSIVKDLLYSYKMGVKTLYYANTNDDKSDDFSKNYKEEIKVENTEEDIDLSCVGGACTI